MEDRLKKLKKKHDEQKMSPIHQKGKLQALGELRKMAQDLMGEHLHGLKKVSVMAPDKEGLEEGLRKAEELVGHGDMSPAAVEHMGHMEPDGDEDGMEEHEEEAQELPEEGQAEEDAELADDGEEAPEDEEELDRKIKELMEKKARLAKR